MCITIYTRITIEDTPSEGYHPIQITSPFEVEQAHRSWVNLSPAFRTVIGRITRGGIGYSYEHSYYIRAVTTVLTLEPHNRLQLFISRTSAGGSELSPVSHRTYFSNNVLARYAPEVTLTDIEFLRGTLGGHLPKASILGLAV